FFSSRRRHTRSTRDWSSDVCSSDLQALNPLLVMLLIPFNNAVLYPGLRRAGFEPTALRRMGAGIAFSGLAWVAAGAMQLVLDGEIGRASCREGGGAGGGARGGRWRA